MSGRGRLDPVQHRHPDVHEDDVGLQRARQRDRLLRRCPPRRRPRCRGSSVEDQPEAVADQRLVVGDAGPGSRLVLGSGRRACTREAAVGRGPASSVPPSTADPLPHAEQAAAAAGPARVDAAAAVVDDLDLDRRPARSAG